MVQGAAAIREQMLELRELQGVVSGFAFDQIQAANDAMERLGKSWEGIWIQATVAAAPILTDLVEILTEMLQLFKFIGKATFGFGKYLIPVYGSLLAIKDTWDWITDAEATKAAAKQKLEAATEKQNTLIADTKALEEERLKAAEAVLKAQEALENRGLKLLESLRTPMEMYTDTIDDLNMMLAEGVIGWITYGRAVEKAQEDIKKSDEFAAKEIRVAERQAVGVAIRGQAGTFSIQQKQHRVLEKIREEERLQLKQLQQQTVLLQQLNNNIQIGVVVGI
jgi:hypothetical protein